MTLKRRIGGWAVLALTALIVADMGLILYRDMAGPSSRDGQRYGHSGFYRVDGVVHAQVPGAGLVALPQADPESFEPLDSDRPMTRHLGRDKRQVYCGDQGLPGLDPARVAVLGQGYLSDGSLSYFCGANSVAHPDQQGLAGFWQAQRHALGWGERRQSHRYPWVKLPAGAAPYRALDGLHLATDGRDVYLAGQRLDGADPGSLHELFLQDRGRNLRPSDYLADARHVYYRGERLALAANPALYVAHVTGNGALEVLIDPVGQGAYAGLLAFDPASGPYQPLAAPGASLNHLLLAGKDGIYYADPERAEVVFLAPVVAAGGSWQLLAPQLVTDGEQTLVQQAGADWARHGRQGGRVLTARWTRVLRLEDGETAPWQAVGAVRQAWGEVWRHGQQEYFLVGSRWSGVLNAPVYRIADAATRRWLLDTQQPPLQDKAFAPLLESGKLAPAQLAEIGTARSVFSRWGGLAVAGLVCLVLLLGLLLMRTLWQWAGWRGRALMSVRGDRLYVGNILRVFYALRDVSQVEIHHGETGGAHGKRAGFKVSAAGKTHRYIVVGRDAQQRLLALQQLLAAHGIRVVQARAQ